MQGIKRTRNDYIYDGINILLMVLVCVITAYPLYFVFIASISDPNAVNAGQVLLFPRSLTLLGYKRIFADSQIWIGYKNTIIYTVLGTLISIGITIPGAYALSRKDLKGRGFVMTLLTITMFFSGGLIPSYILVRNLKLINTIWAIVLPSALSVWNVIIARTFFNSTIPDELLEAASIDGCGNLTFFFKMVLPLSKAIIAVMVLYYAVAQWNSFFSALIYLDNKSMHPLQLVLRDLLIINQSNNSAMMGDIKEVLEQQKAVQLIKYGVIIVSSLPVIILYPFVQKYFIKGVLVGSLKG